MIDFACKSFQLDDVIKCGLGLTKADFKLMDFMMKNDDEWYTTEHLAKDLGLNLSTIQRSVKKLSEKKIISRKQNNIDGGGYFFIYQIRSKPEIRIVITEIINNWSSTVKEAIEKW